MTTENTELEAHQPQSIVPIIERAIQSGIEPAALRELLAFSQDLQAVEAEKLFNVAVADFQKDTPIIDKADDAHGKKYAKMDRIWRTVRPLLAECGLSVTWHVCTIKDGICHVEGRLAHRAGHSITLARDIPLPEMIGGQNAAQQAGSAESYAKRYALCGALGIVTGEDDDADSLGATISAKQAKEIEALLEQIDDMTARDNMLKWAGVDTVEDLPASKFTAAVRGLQSKVKA